MKKVTLIATTTSGVESIVADELRDLGYENLRVDNGKIEFDGELKDICRTNLWLRCAGRVLLKVGEFEARSFEELFENTKALPWEKYITVDGEFPVSKVSSVKSTLFSRSDCQSIVKKAIVERLKEKYSVEWFEENGAKYSIRVTILKDKVTLTIDTSGEGLYKRGYRAHGNEAPLKETLAAALVKISKWKGGERVLMDPTCGTGTILIEAAMIAKNIAPGGNRRFVSETWSIMPEEMWSDARDEAYSMETPDVECNIYGSDIDGPTLDIARENIKIAGFEDCIFVQKLPLVEIRSKHKYGALICNPPYGERLLEKDEVQKLYREMGKVFTQNFDTWSYYIVTSNTDFEKLFGKRATKNRKLYNGGIQCYYYQYYGPKPPRHNKEKQEE